jgi:mono/diheme cytochrome c family protein
MPSSTAPWKPLRWWTLAVVLPACSPPSVGVDRVPPGDTSSPRDAAGATDVQAGADAGDIDAKAPADAGDPCSSAMDAQAIVAHPGHSENVPPAYAGRLDPFPQIPEVVAAGAATYAALCVRCHGAAGRGDGPDWRNYHPRPVSLTAITDHSDSSLLWRVSESGWMLPLCSAMPGYGDEINEDDRWRLIAFLRTLGDAPPFELDAGATPLPPSMVSVNVVGDGIHAAWLLESACDSINVLRSADGGPDVTLASLVANASTHNDTFVTHQGVYCYRAQCVRGGKVSPPSSALCASHAFPDGGMDMDAMPVP